MIQVRVRSRKKASQIYIYKYTPNLSTKFLYLNFGNIYHFFRFFNKYIIRDYILFCGVMAACGNPWSTAGILSLLDAFKEKEIIRRLDARQQRNADICRMVEGRIASKSLVRRNKFKSLKNPSMVQESANGPVEIR